VSHEPSEIILLFNYFVLAEIKFKLIQNIWMVQLTKCKYTMIRFVIKPIPNWVY